MKRFIIIEYRCRIRIVYLVLLSIVFFYCFCISCVLSTVFVSCVFFLLFLCLLYPFYCICILCVLSTVFVSFSLSLVAFLSPECDQIWVPINFLRIRTLAASLPKKESELSGLFFIFCILSFYRVFVASSLCIFLTTGKTRDVPHYFLISPSFPFWKTSLILYYRIWISELRVCSSKYQNPSYFQGDSFLTISRRNTFPLLVPTETIRK